MVASNNLRAGLNVLVVWLTKIPLLGGMKLIIYLSTIILFPFAQGVNGIADIIF
jgi:hypothetical protein